MTDHPARRQHGFTLVELLVVIAIIAIIAGLVVPVLLSGRSEAYKVQCTSNLKQLHAAAMQYSNKKFHFPIARGSDPRAHESLNVLLKHPAGNMFKNNSKLFTCPAGDAVPAEMDDEGEFFLDADTLAFSWVARRTKNTASGVALSSDKYIQGYEDQDGVHSGHEELMMVVRTDGSVTEIYEQDLPEDTLLPENLTR